jgi:hypothetical protein
MLMESPMPKSFFDKYLRQEWNGLNLGNVQQKLKKLVIKS